MHGFAGKVAVATGAGSGIGQALDAVQKNRARVLVGPDVKAMDLVVRLTGLRPERLLGGPVMGRVQRVVTRLLPKR